MLKQGVYKLSGATRRVTYCPDPVHLFTTLKVFSQLSVCRPLRLYLNSAGPLPTTLTLDLKGKLQV